MGVAPPPPSLYPCKVGNKILSYNALFSLIRCFEHATVAMPPIMLLTQPKKTSGDIACSLRLGEELRAMQNQPFKLIRQAYALSLFQHHQYDFSKRPDVCHYLAFVHRHGACCIYALAFCIFFAVDTPQPNALFTRICDSFLHDQVYKMAGFSCCSNNGNPYYSVYNKRLLYRIYISFSFGSRLRRYIRVYL